MTSKNRIQPILLAACLAATLSACGGGGGSSMLTPGTGPGMPAVDPTLTVPEDLARSTAAPVYATTARSYETAGVSTRFPALSSHLQRDFSESTVSLGSDNVRIESISVDDEPGDGGVVVSVNYMLDGEEVTVSFTTDDIVGVNEWRTEIEAREGEGISEFWTWFPLGTFGRFAVLGHSACAEDEDDNTAISRCVRSYTTIGARTEAARLPTGTATYIGTARADSHLKNDPVNRQRIWGLLRLTADFADRRLEGKITDIAVMRQGGEGTSDWPTTYFEIDDGRIVDGQFSATLTGMDSNANAPADESLRSYEGGVLGEFYGPDAKAVGGVFNASRDDRVMQGAIRGEVFNSARLAGSARTALSAGVDLDFSASNSQLTDAARVKAIESDGADGFYVTYTVDGADERVHLPVLNRGLGYESAEQGPHRIWEDRYASALELDHLSVNGWIVDEKNDRRGHFVFGETTATLPAGTAEYAGRAYLNGFSATDPRNRSWLRGDLSLTADFDSRTVGGTMDTWRIYTGDTRQYVGINAELAIQNGTITNDGLNAELVGRRDAVGITGSMTGQFFGPDAAEVGGVIEAESSGDQVFEGWFAGEKR